MPAGLQASATTRSSCLLARLGLRAGDIIDLRIEDIDLRNALVRVSGKSGQETALTLPQDVGDALVDYIVNHRPKAAESRVFLCHFAPFRPFSGPSCVSKLVRRCFDRAGVRTPGRRGAHVLRHSVATEPVAIGCIAGCCRRLAAASVPGLDRDLRQSGCDYAGRDCRTLDRGGRLMLKEEVGRYVALNRKLGRKYHQEERLLLDFVNFAGTKGDGFVRSATAVAWAERPSAHHSKIRLRVVHNFAVAMKAEDPRHEIPPPKPLWRCPVSATISVPAHSRAGCPPDEYGVFVSQTPSLLHVVPGSA